MPELDKDRVRAQPAKQLLTPDNCVVLLIDYQPQMFFAVQSMDRQLVKNNVLGLAKAAAAFRVPTILSAVTPSDFGGPFSKDIVDLFPGNAIIQRTSMNAWEDDAFVRAVRDTGRDRLVIAALWTEVCLTYPTLSAIEQGFTVYPVVDASAGTSPDAHEWAMRRVVQAGAVPVTWLQVMLEWQRDWSREQTVPQVGQIVADHAGAYGQGFLYADAMLGP
jgi:nicotinamidase-related amidase